MKIELELPVPEGWRFLGYKRPLDNEFFWHPTLNAMCPVKDFMTAHELTFERIEPEIDAELEEAKKKFPVGSWFKPQGYPNFIIQVVEVERVKNRIMIFIEHEQWEFYLEDCQPFPLPRWRCCESDKPEKEAYYYLRSKNRDWQRLVEFNFKLEWCRLINASDYEWLDEGQN